MVNPIAAKETVELVSGLPLAPAGKTGWPWTEASPPLPPTLLDGRPWPRVSIVTPSFNQAAFIEKTIRSVLFQGYPNLEYIIIDGGSTDGSVEIIRRYEPWLSYWVSEKDGGQCEAINKGFARATGEIVAWLNSDDFYLPRALCTAVEALEEGHDIVYGRCRLETPDGQSLGRYETTSAVTTTTLLTSWRYRYANPPQPAVFLRRAVLETVGPLNERMHYALDWELWLRASRHYSFWPIDQVLAVYLVHPQSKTGQGRLPFIREMAREGRAHYNAVSWRDRMMMRLGHERLLVSKWELEQAFRGYASGEWTAVRQGLDAGIRANPFCLADRGVRALWLKSHMAHLGAN